MSWTLVVTSHGRWPYLWRMMETALTPDTFDRAVLSFDGVDLKRNTIAHNYLKAKGVEVLTTGPERQGLTANLTQAWGALTPDDEWVFHVEEDFLIGDAPLDEMRATLEANRDVAQMALVRQPWSHEEAAAGGMLYGPHLRGELVDEGGWLRHSRIFTLNPFVAHASLLRSLTPGVESTLTEQCLARGLGFGFWGGMADPPRVIHIGASGGMGSPGWLP